MKLDKHDREINKERAAQDETPFDFTSDKISPAAEEAQRLALINWPSSLREKKIGFDGGLFFNLQF